MALYTFTCSHCHKETTSTASNARFCLKKECQKARKDANRKPKTTIDVNRLEQKRKSDKKIEKTQVAKVGKKINIEKATTMLPPLSSQIRESSPVTIGGPKIERVNDHVIIIRTYNRDKIEPKKSLEE